MQVGQTVYAKSRFTVGGKLVRKNEEGTVVHVMGCIINVKFGPFDIYATVPDNMVYT